MFQNKCHDFFCTFDCSDMVFQAVKCPGCDCSIFTQYDVKSIRYNLQSRRPSPYSIYEPFLPAHSKQPTFQIHPPSRCIHHRTDNQCRLSLLHAPHEEYSLLSVLGNDIALRLHRRNRGQNDHPIHTPSDITKFEQEHTAIEYLKSFYID